MSRKIQALNENPTKNNGINITSALSMNTDEDQKGKIAQI